MTNTDLDLVRTLWRRLELIHAVVYFAPESVAAATALNLPGFWMGYFASRSAAMGPVGPGVVQATFYNFAPASVRRAVPDCWERATPAAVLDGRKAAIDQALRRLLGDDVAARADIVEAARLARPLAEAIGDDVVGRPLFAGHADQPWPEGGDHMTLWWAATLLREHRGDGHLVALVDAEVDGCEALVLHAATGAVPREVLQQSRKWTDDEWSAAVERLAGRGWVDRDGNFTDAGRTARDRIENRTDELAALTVKAVGPEAARSAAEAALPIARALLAAGCVPPITPVGAGEV